MSSVHEIELAGCTPEPLMNYLKALGVLRLVSEQADPDAVGCWRNDYFVLRSTLSGDHLLDFLAREYSPTPIMGPWAGGSGFFGSDNRRAVDALYASDSKRLSAYRNAIGIARRIIEAEELADKPTETAKAKLLRRYRREMPDQFVAWMDATMVLQSDGQSFAPVLGTGGNDGRLDFTLNFMQRLVDLKLHEAKPSSKSGFLLRQSLFDIPTSGLGKASVGQFAPGRAGGPNATQGMEGSSTDNPWDFILALEGVLVLAGSVVRRIGVYASDKASFPFTVRSRPVGGASVSDDELASCRGELWLPIWGHFVGQSELAALFSEGRADVSRHPARDALDFARAIAGLGIDRGIRSFVRYGFFKRSGKAYLATAMNRFSVPDNPRSATDLLQRIDGWLESYNRACSANGTPARFITALRQIESAIFEYCRYGRREDLLSVLVALGQAEREMAVTAGQLRGKEICRPLSRLSPEWLPAVYDDSVEFDIALAIAGLRDHSPSNSIPPVRSNIEPVVFENGRWKWQEAGPHVVWKGLDLAKNMAAVLARRLMDGDRAGCDHLPLHFHRSVSLDAVSAFIAGDVDDQRIDALLWGLLLIDHHQRYPQALPHAHVDNAPLLPREYALLKLLFLPAPLVREIAHEHPQGRWRLARPGGRNLGLHIRPEPRILSLLRAGRIADACRIAHQRLRSSGLTPLPSSRSGVPSSARHWEQNPSLDAHRLLAALLLPLNNRSLNELIQLVTRQDEALDFATLN